MNFDRMNRMNASAFALLRRDKSAAAKTLAGRVTENIESSFIGEKEEDLTAKHAKYANSKASPKSHSGFRDCSRVWRISRL